MGSTVHDMGPGFSLHRIGFIKCRLGRKQKAKLIEINGFKEAGRMIETQEVIAA
ncbi:MAG: hypothetical protein ACXVBT_07450 [Flavisolibacter sp.]